MPELTADLQAAGAHVLGACACDNLVREAARHAPDVLVCWDTPVQGGLLGALQTLLSACPMPVLAFTQDLSAERLEQALQAGVSAWVVHGYAPERLRPLLHLAQARFHHEQAQREALRQMSNRYEERKLLDRAKGMLMRAHGIDEEEAFGRLRSAAMQGKRRVGQVAQQLIEAARDAGAVNRAGQLRMLSQRIVKLQALRTAAVEAGAANALQAQSLERAADLVGQLQRAVSQATFGDLLHEVAEAFRSLKQAVSAAPDVDRLQAAQLCAERMLEGADRLTAALQAAGGQPALRVVNTCGRQRMLSQRFAKEALLAVLLPSPLAARAVQRQQAAADALQAGLASLEKAPLSDERIRGLLCEAEGEWQRLQNAAAGAGQPAGQREIAQASEAMLALFETLTERYEQAMQSLTA